MNGAVKSTPSVADAYVGRLISMGVNAVWVVDATPDKEIHIKHPDLPGVLILPIPTELRLHVDSDHRIGEHLIKRLTSALDAERNTPNAD